MRPQERALIGMNVRVREDHRIKELRGTVGEVVGSYGGEELMVLEYTFRMDATSYCGPGI